MHRKILLAGALALFTCGAFAQDGAWTLGTGLHYSSGDYGTSATTTILSVPFTARYDTGPWSLRASVPYLEVSGPSAVIPGVGAVGAGVRPQGLCRRQPGLRRGTKRRVHPLRRARSARARQVAMP